MARYVYRFTILGPRQVDPGRLASVVGPAFGRVGLRLSSLPRIVEVKGLPAPRLLPATNVGTDAETLPVYAVNVAPWGDQILDDTAAAAAVSTMTKLTVDIEGTLPPDRTTRTGVWAGRAQVTSMVNDAIFSGLGPEGFYNLSGGSRDAGFVGGDSGRSAWPFVLGGVALGGLAAWFSESGRGSEI